MSEVQSKEIQMVPLKELKPWSRNRNKHSKEQIERLVKIIEYQGWRQPIVVSRLNGFIAAGHGRYEAAKQMGLEMVPVMYQDFESEDQQYAFMVSDNAVAAWAELDLSGINADVGELGPDFDLELLGIKDFKLDPSGLGGGEQQERPKLADRFLAPPFSVLDARQGYWKARKQQWLSLGIKSEIGREGNRLGMSETVLQLDKQKREIATAYKEMLKSHGTGAGSIESKIPNYYKKKNSGMSDEQIIADFLETSQISSGTSIFDPVLCELCYRWFSPDKGTIIDPFAGGSVRGIVASLLGRQYAGCELRQEQVDANKEQAAAICSDPAPVWACGDSMLIDQHLSGVSADMIFSCPPYADLEVYSDDPKDLSTMPYDAFVSAYREIIRKAVEMLTPDRFACFVVGEVREPGRDGYYRNFVTDTIRAFEDAGARFYNEIVLVTAIGTLPIRAARMFSASRKVGKTHQNVLVFCKGSPRKATEACGLIEISEDFFPSDEEMAL